MGPGPGEGEGVRSRGEVFDRCVGSKGEAASQSDGAQSSSHCSESQTPADVPSKGDFAVGSTARRSSCVT